jgi:hypothetical protein
VTAVRYFAVPDPDDPNRMTYWFRTDGGWIRPWPKGAEYGPLPEPVESWNDWQRRVWAAIEADPDGAAARFAKAVVRCGVCGRLLTDPLSRELGRGPDCRDGIPEERMDAARARVRRLAGEDR